MSKTNENNKVDPDTIFKNYWRDNSRFADIVNAFLSKNLISPDELEELDTDMSIFISKDDNVDSKKGARDILKIAKVSKKTGMCFLIVGLENQTYVDYAMPVRVLVYDGTSYYKQVKSIADSYDKQDLKPGNEFLSGIKQSDTITPVYTIVLYYGEEPWNGPKSLHDMFGPEYKDMLPFINDYHLNLLEVKDNNLTFHNRKNIDFFNLLNIFFDKTLSLKERREKAIAYSKENKPDRTVTFAAVKAAKIKVDFSKIGKDESGDIMCELFDGLAEEAKQEGLIEGRIEGSIITYIQTCKEFDVSNDDLKNRVMVKFNLSETDCNNYIKEALM